MPQLEVVHKRKKSNSPKIVVILLVIGLVIILMGKRTKTPVQMPNTGIDWVNCPPVDPDELLKTGRWKETTDLMKMRMPAEVAERTIRRWFEYSGPLPAWWKGGTIKVAWDAYHRGNPKAKAHWHRYNPYKRGNGGSQMYLDKWDRPANAKWKHSHIHPKKFKC